MEEHNSGSSAKKLGTKLLREKGYDPNGRPLNEKSDRQISAVLFSPQRLASLKVVEGIGGGISRCVLGKRNADLASDFDDNSLTLIEHAIEGAE